MKRMSRKTVLLGVISNGAVRRRGDGANVWTQFNHERSRVMNKVSKRIALLGVISPVLFAVGAMAQPIQLHSTLAGNNPTIVIGGVESASAPWTVKSGFASLDASGKLHVRVRDLILPATGDAGPVTAVSASLVCGG